MKNGDRPAHPAPWLEQDLDSVGLTKREEFAKAAMIGFLCTDITKENEWSVSKIVKGSVYMADALLAELEKPHE